jgi:bacitracin transport system ATP-binding protein
MNILEIKDLYQHYGKHKVLDGLNVNVPKGKIYGFIGRNGAGKTTTIRIILGLLRFRSGSIFVKGNLLSRANSGALGRIGCIIEFPGFYPNLSGFDNLKVFQQLHGDFNRGLIEEKLELVGLSGVYAKKVKDYSLGMRQRLGLARALLNDPEILILDEPNNGLDPSGIHEMRVLLKSLSTDRGITIFLSSHILSEIEQIVDIVGIIKDGKMIEEISIQALREKCSQCLKIKVSNPKQAAELLLKIMNIKCKFDISDVLCIEEKVNPAAANRLLIENGYEVSALENASQTLEDYFLNMTNEIGIL